MCSKCSKLTTVSPAPPIFLSTIFWIQRLSVIRLIFHKWRLIFALAIVDDPTPHRLHFLNINFSKIIPSIEFKQIEGYHD